MVIGKQFALHALFITTILGAALLVGSLFDSTPASLMTSFGGLMSPDP